MRAQFFDCLDQLVKLVSIARESTTVFRDKKGCNIEEVMEELHSIDGVNFDNTLHTFAIEFFCVRSKR
jgi:transcription antitermination factor NusA-like protein